VVIVVVMMPVVVMMGLTDSHHHLRLRRKRCCEAENEGQCEQNLLHFPSMSACPSICRAALTSRTAQAEYMYISLKSNHLKMNCVLFALLYVILYEQTPLFPGIACKLFPQYITFNRHLRRSI